MLKILILAIVPISAICQTTGTRNIAIALPQLALLDIEPAGTIVMNFLPPTDAGRPIASPAVNTSKWINYTSAIATGGASRSVTVAINQPIPGINIRLQAAAASGSSGGTLGSVSGQIILTTVPQVIISGIGGAFTGTGTSNGHRLTFSIAPNNYANLAAGNNNIVVATYTIIE